MRKVFLLLCILITMLAGCKERQYVIISNDPTLQNISENTPQVELIEPEIITATPTPGPTPIPDDMQHIHFGKLHTHRRKVEKRGHSPCNTLPSCIAQPLHKELFSPSS